MKNANTTRKAATKAPRAAKTTRSTPATVTSASKTRAAAGQGCVQPSALTEEAIAARAYEIWQQKGCPPGCEEENWRQAEAELNGTNHHPVAA